MNDDLRNIWIEVDGHLSPKSENELREILLLRSRLIINKFRRIWGLGTAICTGVLIFLAFASFSLHDDILYLINNSLLAILLVSAMIYNFRVYYDPGTVSGESSSVYSRLQEKLRRIEKAMQQKKQLFLLPVFSLLLLFAIHVYYSGGSFRSIFSNEEDMWGITFGFISGLLIAVYFERKINRKQENDLKALRTYLQELEKKS